ncbi:hypothetical protein HB763_19315 [Vibrio campbellii]|uniref:hypothetical protein n=1 Tax=Vibrio campbellii TaxID=680 RepID=UPI0021098521|nr:hypothetical protein [Vibrio campbellii]UTZ38756.1 hypothetical protein HB763_19315 [Vibrio campbellii]
MNSKIKFIALSALASAMTFTSVASQAAVDGSVEVKFQSSITSASCDVGVFDDNGSQILSNTVVLPSLTLTDITADNDVVGDATDFSVGPLVPADCAYTDFQIGATGDVVTTDVLRNSYADGAANMGVKVTLKDGTSILNTIADGSVGSAGDPIELTSQLFHVGSADATTGLIGATTTITTAYY